VRLADAAGPTGLLSALLGTAMIGEGHWFVVGVALAAIGVLLMALSR
jgi:hypothetical protein